MFVGEKQKKLVDFLLKMGKISPEDTRNWQDLDNEKAEKELLAKGVNPEEIAKAYASIFDIPFVSLKNLQIPHESLEAIPENLAREYKIIAYEYNFPHKILKLAVARPSNLTTNLEEVLNDLKNRKGIGIELALTTPADFDLAVNQYQNLKTEPQAVQVPVNVSNPSATSKTQIPPIDLENVQIPHEVITKFPEDIARKYKMVVFEAPHPSFIKVAVADPEDKKVREILDFVREKNDIAIQEFTSSPGQIHNAFRFYEIPKETEESTKQINSPLAELSPRQFKPKPAEVTPPVAAAPQVIKQEVSRPVASEEEIPEVKSKLHEVVVNPEENDLDKFLGQEIKDADDLQAIAEEANVPKTVAAAIALAVRRKASDIHIEPAEGYLRIRYRVDGILRDIIKLPLEQQPAIISRIKILSNLKLDESRVPQDGRFDTKTAGHQIDLRISTLPTVHGEKVAMRILDKSLKMYTLEELGLTGKSLKIVIDNIDKPYGIILSTGPTGSGKSTTLYAILSRISTASVNIVTLEDPVEYEIPGINQCQIKPKIGFTFANGLRSVLRQDPNIIMVGEIRDAETASLATHAALTGHLVLSTLHTNDATGALPRLINMGVEPFLITSSINCIVGQRLVRKLCPKCKKPAHIPAPVQKEIEEELAKLNLQKPYQFFEGRGCDECDQGYSGRIGIFEVLPMVDKIESLAISRRPASEIKAEAVSEGMMTMKQDGLIKALKGITTVNEVLRVVSI